MSFKTAFGKFVDSVEARINKSAPPIPFATKPNISHRPSSAGEQNIYWQPIIHPSKAVADDFGHELGQSGWGNAELQNYTASPENSFFTPDGKLVIRGIVASTALSQEQKYTSARLTSHHRLSRQQGCLSVKLTAPLARGIWPAVWLLPADPFQWPNDGEVDIFEAWNGDATNHSCLHWGHFNGEDWDKHRVTETPIPQLTNPRGMEFALVWQQPEDGRGGKLLWYIDGKPVMKASIPEGTRRISDWRLIINVAMGGNVCNGAIPDDGTYDMIIHSLRMKSQPSNGWNEFERHWKSTKEGHAM